MLDWLTGSIPPARRAVLRHLRDLDGKYLDQALVLWFPGPGSATGEDCAELHCHGGRAVVATIRFALAGCPGLREALPGEFTRRAFANGKIDLAQAEALADLLAAETRLQLQVAQQGLGGALSKQVEQWRLQVLQLSAAVEAELDLADEGDVAPLDHEFQMARAALRAELDTHVAAPRSERLRDGIRVVLAGPPNCGKSSLFNALVEEDAVIVSATAGTTRDFIERPVALSGIPFMLVDTAGLRDDFENEIEALGIESAQIQLARADLVLWLGEEGRGPVGALEVQSKADDPASPAKLRPDFRVSSRTGKGIATLRAGLIARAQSLLPHPGDIALNERQAALLVDAAAGLAVESDDVLLVAEGLRQARSAFDSLVGRSGVEDMLDTLFLRFCVGK